MSAYPLGRAGRWSRAVAGLAAASACIALPASAEAYDRGGLSAGRFHTCAIDASYSPQCWGPDFAGRVSGPSNAPGTYGQISAGMEFTCAIDAAASIDCWGNDSFGRVSGPANAPGAWKEAVAGEDISCAIDSADSITCWGNPPQAIPPTEAAGSFHGIVTGTHYVCALDAADSISCWGSDSHGQVSGADAAPGAFHSLSGGGRHVCALDPADSISCWGTADPAVTGPSAAPGTFKQVKAGNGFTCAIDAADSISCWGNDNNGEVAAADAAEGTFKDLSTGGGTCAIDSEDSISCWGLDWGGGIVDADAAPGRWGFTFTPVDQVPPDTEITSGPSGEYAEPNVTNDRTPSFTFTSEPGAVFECQIDGGGWSACSSPHATAELSDGEHTFRVRARDGAGNPDPSPASVTFTVRPKCSLIGIAPLGIRICILPVYASGAGAQISAPAARARAVLLRGGRQVAAGRLRSGRLRLRAPGRVEAGRHTLRVTGRSAAGVRLGQSLTLLLDRSQARALSRQRR